MENKYATYIGRFYLKNYLCFRDKNSFNLLDDKNQPLQWTVILGNNNTGKTSILKAIADLEPVYDEFKNGEKVIQEYVPLYYAKKWNIIGLKASKFPFESVECEFSYKEIENKKKYFAGNFNIYGQERYWTYTPNFSTTSRKDNPIIKKLLIYGYGVTRRVGTKGLSENKETLNAETIFYPESSLINIEEWLLQLDYASKNNQEKATENLDKIRKLIKSGVFPEIKDFKFETSEALKNYVSFKTNDGWHTLDELGYGYQTTLSWIIDFCKKMFERYPDSKNPLSEPAILLIDELDLHLHPSWQKNIVEYLTKLFPATQFIVTTHSPLIIQSIDKLNLFILSKEGKYTKVHKSPRTTFKGWTVEEILEDTMNIENGGYSEAYEELFNQFDKALDSNDYKKALDAYNQLDKILHPESPQRKILKIQLSQLDKNDKITTTSKTKGANR